MIEDETKAPIAGAQTSFETAQAEPQPLPNNLRYLMFGLLVVGVVGIVIFGYLRQTSVKPPATPQGAGCKDPVTENRLSETLKQSPNDFATLMDWGSYNLNCEKNYAVAVASYRQATILADNQATSKAQPAERIEAHFRLGLAFLYNQSFQEAQDQFQLIVNEDPRNSSALLALGASLGRTDPAKAEPYLKRIIEIEPANSEVSIQAKALLDSLSKRPDTTPKG